MQAKPQQPDDPMRHLAGYALRRASTAMMTELADELRPLGLRPVEATVVLVIWSKPGATQSDIGRMLNILRANMTPLAIGLERSGLVRRDKADGRSRGLVLTEKGKAVAAKVQKAFEASDRSITARVPAKHRAAFLAALYALWDSYEAEQKADRVPAA
jgi:DNA-binding MarR family transcriptional regulator